jgi:hypothetical protein
MSDTYYMLRLTDTETKIRAATIPFGPARLLVESN